MADFPSISVAIAFSTAPLATPAWTDVTPYLLYPLRIQRGRQYELAEIEAGTLDLSLNNLDRRFEPAWSGGPYYPNIRPGRRIRVQATWNSVIYDLYHGFIESWQPKEDVRTGEAWIEVRAADAFGLFGRTSVRTVLLWHAPWPSVTTDVMVVRQPGGRKIVLTANTITGYESVEIHGVDTSGVSRIETPVIGATPYTSTYTYATITKLRIFGPSAANAGTATLDVIAESQFPSEYSHWATHTLLNAAAWPAADRSIEGGQSLLQAYSADSDDVLTVLKRIAESENGTMFMGRDGRVVFQDRHARITSTSVATFGDGPGELPYGDVTWSVEDTRIANEVSITRAGGATQTAIDIASQEDYGIRSLSKSGLLISSDLEALSAATWLLRRYKAPGLRAARLSIDGAADPATLWPLLLPRELSDRITVIRRPAAGITYQQDVFIEAMQISIDTTAWRSDWQLSPAGNETAWVLGSALLGVDTYLVY